jgi:hypothetical protein
MNEKDQELEQEVKPRDNKSDGRFQTIVAILIAVVSVISAAVIWRASMAGSSASTADRQGMIDEIQYQAAYAQTVARLYEEARYASQHDSYQARVTALEDLDGAAAQKEAEWINQVVINLALFTPLATEAKYRTSSGGLDLAARLDDIRAADADLRDLNPQQSFDAADQYYIEAQVLIAAVIVFAVALFFLTLAEITSHKLRFGLALAGVVIFLIGLGGALIGELYFMLSRLIA